MKAAIITAFDPFVHKGGIESYTLQIVGLLRGQGIDADIYHTGLIGEDLGFRYDILGKMYALGRRFTEVDGMYDFVISNSFYGLGYFPPRIKAFTIYHSSHVTFDKSVEGIISPVTSLKWTYLCGYLGEMVSGFDRRKIAVSDAVKEEIERHYGFDDVMVVESGVDVGFFRKSENKKGLRQRYGIPEDAFVGLFVGRWDRTKGNDIIEKMIEMTKDVWWILVLGSGSGTCLMQNRKNIIVLEEVAYEEMPLIYSLSDFMFFPSRYEGFGLVIIEAMACGLPVFVGEIGVAKKIYRGEPYDLLKLPDFSLAEEEFFSGCLEKIYFLRTHNELIRSVADEGRKLVEKEYNMNIWQRRMLRALDLA